MRKPIMAVVGAVLLVSACGSGDEPRPAPSYVAPEISMVPSTPAIIPSVSESPTTLLETPSEEPQVSIIADPAPIKIERREPEHVSRVPTPGPTREPVQVVPTTKAPPPPPRMSTLVPPTTKPPPPSTKPTGNVLTIGGWSKQYITAYKNQKAVDQCKAVEWEPQWIVGHNHCGYAFWAFLGIGDTFTVSGKDAGTYTVNHLVYLPYQGGKVPLFTHTWDFVLQTCKGQGTQLVFAQKTG